jgi:Fic family protein
MKKAAPGKANRQVQNRNRYSIEDKEKARKYYLMGLNLKEISKLLNDCPVRTIEKWQKTGSWTDLKKAENIQMKTLELHESGKSYAEIAEILKISRVTVWRYIKVAKTIQMPKNGLK